MTNWRKRLKKTGWYSHIQEMGYRSEQEFLGFIENLFAENAILLLQEEEFRKNKEKTLIIPETRERIGQYIWNAMAQADRWESPDGNPLFFISDEDLLEIIENYNK